MILNGLTNSEAIADGKAVLDDLYGSPSAALAEMKRLAPGLSDAQYENISAIAATSVLAVLAKSYSTPATLAAARAMHRKAAEYWRQSFTPSSRAFCKAPEASLPAAAQAAELYQLFRHAAQNHTAQTARKDADA